MKRDYPVVMGTLYFFSLIGLFAKLLNDLMYIWVDPRVQFEASRS
jgi:microcin C transport system permease protein